MAKTREERLAYQRKYNAEHAIEKNQKQRVYNAEHKEEQAEYSKEYREKNKDNMVMLNITNNKNCLPEQWHRDKYGV